MEKQPIAKQRTFDAVFDIVLKHPFIFVALFFVFRHWVMRTGAKIFHELS